MRSETGPAAGSRLPGRIMGSGGRRLVLNCLCVAAVVVVELLAGGDQGTAARVLTFVLAAQWIATSLARHLVGRPGSTLAWTAMLVVASVAAGLSRPGNAAADFAMGAGVFLVVSSLETTAAAVAAAVCLGAVAYGVAHQAVHGSPGPVLSVLISSVAGGGFGFLRRTGRRERLAERDAEERRAERSVLEERARIARDIHDVLAHSLGGLVLQLDALETVTAADGASPAVLERVRGARQLAADGLVEAKRAVEALRRLPPGIDAALGEVVRAARGLGMTVAVDLRGDPARVPPAVAEVLASLTVEALTNARKHAPGSLVDVRLDVTGRSALLTVANPLGDRPPAAVPSGGHGLAGMRERAGLVGGTLTSAARNGLWIVTCEVPHA